MALAAGARSASGRGERLGRQRAASWGLVRRKRVCGKGEGAETVVLCIGAVKQPTDPSLRLSAWRGCANANVSCSYEQLQVFFVRATCTRLGAAELGYLWLGVAY